MTIKNPYLKIVLQALAIAVFGFILLNLIFLFDALFQSLIDLIIKPFTSVNVNMDMDWSWFPQVKHVLFVVVIGVVSWWVFRSKLNPLYKAIFMTVPTAVVLATVGITMYQWPVVPYVVGGLLTLGTLYYFYKTKQPWFYYYSVILIALALMIMGILGVDI